MCLLVGHNLEGTALLYDAKEKGGPHGVKRGLRILTQPAVGTEYRSLADCARYVKLQLYRGTLLRPDFQLLWRRIAGGLSRLESAKINRRPSAEGSNRTPDGSSEGGRGSVPDAHTVRARTSPRREVTTGNTAKELKRQGCESDIAKVAVFAFPNREGSGFTDLILISRSFHEVLTRGQGKSEIIVGEREAPLEVSKLRGNELITGPAQAPKQCGRRKWEDISP